MSLIDKLTGTDGKLPVHQFWAALHEMAAGEKAKADVMSAFNLQAGTSDETELDWLIAQYNGSTDKPAFVHAIHGLFILSEVGMFGYDDKATIQARIERLS